MLKPLLVAFDFDHTIIDDNSDIVVRNLIPTTEIPAEVQDLYRSDGWTAYMQQIFYILHSKGITSAQIKDVINKIPVIPGLDDVMKFLHKNNSEIIVVSDSNSVFINEWLKNASLDSLINHVFTNPARFNPEGCLEIEMYHAQDWCTICTKNLCKGHILDTYIEDRKKNGVNQQLAIFDFDHTLVHGDTTTILEGIFQEGEDVSDKKIVHSLSKDVVKIMNDQYCDWHSKGVKHEQLREKMLEIRITDCMEDLVKFLKNDNTEIVILSDLNTILINDWLRIWNLEPYIDKVISNPSTISYKKNKYSESLSSDSWLCPVRLIVGATSRHVD
uniref:Pyridoxal phosphate phosphatase PHOSPHO2 n=1 Tax=Timema shepardi TaxID=629360 RepID=A0A7R9AK37_TIMSH|nr:unnamed protein product [Timema shepardi]